ncbi:hypothetical protein [Parasitella parasitica]|uniref:Retrotransposon gag domain-containing protein n=1 Tax=Parasitella parasitica TaxID=35722 RepID=A0A0B7NJ36_9FUNG|nr:hypothetical protein [Parasitella parasitica]
MVQENSISPVSNFIGPLPRPSSVPGAQPIMSKVIQGTSQLSIDNDTVMEYAGSNKVPLSEDDPLTRLFKAVKSANDIVERARVYEAELIFKANSSNGKLNAARQAVVEAESKLLRVKTLLDLTRLHDAIPLHRYQGVSADAQIIKETPTAKADGYAIERTSGSNDGQFNNTVAQFFKAFERMFRLQNVDIVKPWRDNLANVIGTENADWCEDTIEAKVNLTYDEAKEILQAHFESPSKAINMFARLILLKQRTEESVNNFSKRFIRTAHAPHVPDNNILARL